MRKSCPVLPQSPILDAKCLLLVHQQAFKKISLKWILAISQVPYLFNTLDLIGKPQVLPGQDQPDFDLILLKKGQLSKLHKHLDRGPAKPRPEVPVVLCKARMEGRGGYFSWLLTCCAAR